MLNTKCSNRLMFSLIQSPSFYFSNSPRTLLFVNAPKHPFSIGSDISMFIKNLIGNNLPNGVRSKINKSLFWSFTYNLTFLSFISTSLILILTISLTLITVSNNTLKIGTNLNHRGWSLFFKKLSMDSISILVCFRLQPWFFLSFV